MPYQVTFSDDREFLGACLALERDLQRLGLSSLNQYPRIQINANQRSIAFDGSFMELAVLFGNLEHSETAGFIPFNTEYAPTAEGFDQYAREHSITGVSVTRTQGDITRTYLASRDAALQFMMQPLQTRSPSETTVDHAFQAALEQGRDIVINEVHGGQAHLRFIIDRIPNIARTGSAILLEHFFQEQQPLIDAFLRTSPGTPMPPELTAYIDRFIDPRLNGIPPGSAEYSTRRLFEIARDHGVPIIAIETEEAFAARSLRLANHVDGVSPDIESYGAADRMLMMNTDVARIAQARRQINPSAGVIVGAGSSHGVDFPVERAAWVSSRASVTGLGSLLNALILFPIDEGHVAELRNYMVTEHTRTGQYPSWARHLPHHASDFVFTLDTQGNPFISDTSSLRPSEFSTVDPRELGAMTAPHLSTSGGSDGRYR